MSHSCPNILWICTDQQRYDTLRCNGSPFARSPHLDQLAEEGARFTHAYCQSPVCTPSRASFLTGRYPRTNRCRQNGQMIPANERLISRILADAGYTCGLAGKLHLASASDGKIEQRIDDGYKIFHWSHHPQPDWGNANAYTNWLHEQGTSWKELYGAGDSPWVPRGVPAEFHQTTWCAERAMDFIQEQQGGGPWMFSLNCFDPHHPFDPPPEYLDRYNPDEMPLPEYRAGELDQKPSYQKYDQHHAADGIATYDFTRMSDDDKRLVTAANFAMCELIDDQVGRILDCLRETGQQDSTIVIFMSDHGEMLGDHGFYLKGPHFYEQAVRVPLILRFPEQYQQGLVVEGLVELLDLAPTLLETAGLPVPVTMQGKSLLPILRGESPPEHHREDVFCEYLNSWSHPGSYASMLRTEHWKIVVNHALEIGELYDLQNDPGEFVTLWNHPEHRESQSQLVKQCFDRSVFCLDPTPERAGPF